MLFRTNWKYLAAVATPALLLIAVTGLHEKKVVARQNPYANLKAFLAMIQVAEGTYGRYAYRTLYGGMLFSGYSAHPNIAITSNGITSTAAGAYQMLYSTWLSVAQPLGLEDFSPANQDRGAVELIRRRGALEDVLAGRLETAISKCRKEWASLPGAGYGQRERSMAYLVQVYRGAGGQL
jgi:lysozyme